MNGVMASGISALHTASAQASRAAAQVIEATHETIESDPPGEALSVGAPSAETPPPAEPPQTPTPPPPSPVTVSGLETLSFIDGMVDLMRAEHAYKASAAIIRTGDEMMRETLDLV